MEIKYGYQIANWKKAKEDMRQVLIERAKVRGMISYSELTSKITAIHIEPKSYALAAMLGEISEDENAAGRGMLSVIVVHKSGDMQPGHGFFEFAKELDRDTSDILKCWVEELKKVHGYWSSKKNNFTEKVNTI